VHKLWKSRGGISSSVVAPSRGVAEDDCGTLGSSGNGSDPAASTTASRVANSSASSSLRYECMDRAKVGNEGDEGEMRAASEDEEGNEEGSCRGAGVSDDGDDGDEGDDGDNGPSRDTSDDVPECTMHPLQPLPLHNSPPS